MSRVATGNAFRLQMSAPQPRQTIWSRRLRRSLEVATDPIFTLYKSAPIAWHLASYRRSDWVARLTRSDFVSGSNANASLLSWRRPRKAASPFTAPFLTTPMMGTSNNPVSKSNTGRTTLTAAFMGSSHQSAVCSMSTFPKKMGCFCRILHELASIGARTVS